MAPRISFFTRLFVVIAVLEFVLVNDASADLKGRMNACFSQVKSEPTGRGFKKGWTSSCNIPSELLAYEAAADTVDGDPGAEYPFIASGRACTRPLPKSVAFDGARCGMASNLIASYRTSVIRINLPGGRCMHAIPVLLTDKTEGFTCTSLRARIACVRARITEGDKTRVLLSSVLAGGGSSGEVVIGNAPEANEPLFQQSEGQPLFALMPTWFDNYGQRRSTVRFLQRQLRSIRQSCERDHSARHCSGQLPYHAERLLMEQLRRAWTPRLKISPSNKTADKESFKTALRAVSTGPSATKDRRALLQSIIENEIGVDSPYQVLDAITDMSGPSWGANQIDIGANDDDEIALYWRIISDHQASDPTPQLAKADQYKACFSAPIRHYYVNQLSGFYSSVPDINKALRGPSGQDSYNRFFIDWLLTETDHAAAYDGLFKESAFTRLFYVDVRNQFGPRKANLIREAGEKFTPGSFGRCGQIADKEDELVQLLRDRVSDTRKEGLDRRVHNLRKAVQAVFGHDGRSGCS